MSNPILVRLTFIINLLPINDTITYSNNLKINLVNTEFENTRTYLRRIEINLLIC